MLVSKQEEYFQYLLKRSRLGVIYRRYLLYPRLKKIMRGKGLDIGCGIGDFLKFRQNTVGADINPKIVAWCQAEGLNVHLMEPNRLPFEGQSFDSVILDNVLEHIEDPSMILLEIHRILKQSGVLIVGVPGALGYSSDSDHKIFYTKESLIKKVTYYDFLVDDLFGMPLNFDWLGSKINQYCVYAVFKK
jgi:SAM-dependent methyltransferase